MVGGIDRGTWVFWRNINFSSVTNGGVAASAANIQHYMNATWRQIVRGTDKPDLIVADGNYWTFYLESLQAIQRIQVENGPPEMAEAGFETLKYMSADVVLDGGFQGFSGDPLPGQTSTGNAVGGAPSNSMWFLSESATIH